MYLKQLTIQGFKSFPEATTITFHQGITAIVGPNGSGKSNVTDAIRWVLGEQSAKTLRGSHMEDVIFNGTESRRRLSLAEVSITFDNSDHALPIDFDTVVIRRQYFRSGESDYAINGTSCRLKDIHALFADTGVGRDGYSIIGQGKVDDLLSDRSEDRRRIFDEAAGIVKYKMRKDESLRKLDKTDQNLLRIQDLYSELEARISPLKKQAEEALRYQELSKEIRYLDIGLVCNTLSQSDDQTEKLAQEIEDINNEITQVEQTRQQLIEEGDRASNLMSESEKASEEKRRCFQEHSATLTNLAEQNATATSQRKSDQEALNRLQEEQEAIDQSRSDLESKLMDRRNHAEKLQGLKDEAQKRLEDLEQEQRLSEEKLTKLDQATEQRRLNLESCQNRLFQLRSQLLQNEASQKSLKERFSETQETLKEIAQKRSQWNQDLEETTQKQSKLKKEQSEVLEEIQKAEQEVSDCKKALKELEESVQTESVQQKNWRYQLETLRRLEENREGYHPAVRELGDEIKHNPAFGEGFIGPFGELIRVSQEAETAVEMSLGSAIHQIVTRSHRDASRFIDWLKKNRKGRETFLPIDRLDPHPISNSEKKEMYQIKGYLGTLDEFIELEPYYQSVALFLGGRTVVTDTLENALVLSKQTRQKWRVVTLEGDLVNPGGSMTGGQSKHGLSGLLSRKREIDKAESSLEESVKKQEKYQKVFLEKRGHLLEIGQKTEQLHQAHLTLEKDLFRLDERIEQTSHVLAETGIQEEELNKQIQEWIRHQESVDADQIRLKEAISHLENEQEALQNSIDQESTSRTDENRHREELREQIANTRVTVSTFEESIRGIWSLHQQLLDQNQLSESRLKMIDEEKNRLDAHLKKLDEDILAFGKQQKDVQESCRLIELELTKLHEERLAVQQAEKERLEKLENYSQKRTTLLTQQERLAQRLAQQDEQDRVQKNYLWETYEITFQQAKETATIPENISQAKKRLKDLRLERQSLPAINHNAPEEYREVSERYEFLTAEKEELEKTRTHLVRVIEDLEKAMRIQFQNELNRINEAFQKTFSELFDGGWAELSLGEGDLLTCAIDIKAQPPGKRLQNLTLLSGGERAMTAVAILFAIFSLRPAPFCILDEVESALDDANVLRFTDYIRHYTDTTQFVLVTHRKGTMEAAERLYGITMKERGVSSLYSMTLSDPVAQQLA